MNESAFGFRAGEEIPQIEVGKVDAPIEVLSRTETEEPGNPGSSVSIDLCC